ncbi:hypothetical protein KC345_g11247, partial [Hortaea werneckii]
MASLTQRNPLVPVDHLEPVYLSQLRDNLAAWESLNAAELGIIIIDDAPAEQLRIRTKYFDDIPGVEVSFDPLDADRQQAVSSVKQCFYRTFVDI